MDGSEAEVGWPGLGEQPTSTILDVTIVLGSSYKNKGPKGRGPSVLWNQKVGEKQRETEN